MENEFKGHFHDGEITWMHPYPKQIIGEEKEAENRKQNPRIVGRTWDFQLD